MNATVFHKFPEDEILAKNVRNMIALHAGTGIRFLTDNDCLLEYGKLLLWEQPPQYDIAINNTIYYYYNIYITFHSMVSTHSVPWNRQ